MSSQFKGGAIKDKRDRRDYHLSGISGIVELPSSFRLNDPFPIKNQNGFGSCTGQAAAGHKQLQEGIELSARFAYAMTKKLEGNKDWGAYTRNQFKVLTETGAVSEESWPERHDISEQEYLDWNIIPFNVVESANKHKSQKYWRVEPDFESIKQAIYQYKQAVVISVPWYISYNQPKDGYLALDKDLGWRFGHAVLIEGWQEDWLILRNSYGDTWGLNGICYFHKSFPIWDVWISTDHEKKLPINLYYGRKRMWSDFMIEKGIAFNPWLIKKIGRLPSNIEITALRFNWPYEAVFKGKFKDAWLYETYIDYLKNRSL